MIHAKKDKFIAEKENLHQVVDVACVSPEISFTLVTVIRLMKKCILDIST